MQEVSNPQACIEIVFILGAMLLSTLIAVLSPDKNAYNSPHESSAQNEYLELTEGLSYKNFDTSVHHAETKFAYLSVFYFSAYDVLTDVQKKKIYDTQQGFNKRYSKKKKKKTNKQV